MQLCCAAYSGGVVGRKKDDNYVGCMNEPVLKEAFIEKPVVASYKVAKGILISSFLYFSQYSFLVNIYFYFDFLHE